MMELLAAAFEGGKRRQCSFGRMLDSLPPELRGLVERLMSNPDISTRKIHLALASAGASIGRDVIGDHREKRCICKGANNER